MRFVSPALDPLSCVSLVLASYLSSPIPRHRERSAPPLSSYFQAARPHELGFPASTYAYSLRKLMPKYSEVIKLTQVNIRKHHLNN